MSRIEEKGAQLVAASCDSPFTLRVFSASLGGLPFPVASDWMRENARAYGVLEETHGISRRSTFVIDSEGALVYANRAFEPGNPEHYEAVLMALPS
jgi:peroxiredoxin